MLCGREGICQNGMKYFSERISYFITFALNLKFNKYTHHYNSIQVQVAILFQEYERSTRDYILLASFSSCLFTVFVGRFETKLETLTSEARSL